MKYLLTILALSLVITIHEIGHAVAMYKNNVEIKEFGVGLPIIPWGIRKRISRIRIFGVDIHNLDVCLWPFLIGAYVMPTIYGELRLERLPSIERMRIWYAGPFVNLLAALVCLSIYGFFSSTLFGFFSTFISSLFGLFFALPFFLKQSTTRQRGIVKFLLVIIPLSALGLLALYFQPSQIKGPVGLVAETPEVAFSFAMQFVVLSLSIAIFNLLPVPPLDGGKIVVELLEGFGMSKKISRIIAIAGSILLFMGIAIITINDISRLLK